MSNDEILSKILIYTRKPKNEYTESLSNSIHFAYSTKTGDFVPLNRNYGILFAQATVDSDNVIQEKGIKNPYLFRISDGTFGIIAVRITKEGGIDEESKGYILLWTSKDLTSFQYQGLIKLHEELYVREAVCEYKEKENRYDIHWQSEEGDAYVNSLKNLKETDRVTLPVSEKGYSFIPPVVPMTDIVPGNILAIDEETGEAEIENHYSENLSLKYLGEKYYINSAYLGQLFKKNYGYCFKDYLNGIRMRKAAETMLRTNKKIYEIAEEVGYKNIQYFINKFEDIYGMTPSRFRKKI